MKSLQSQLKRWCVKNGFILSSHKKEKSKQRRKSPKNKKKEYFSRREIEELMGIRRVTYKRVKGAIRRK